MSLAMSHIQPDKMGNATSIFNLMRNIGGSVGIALMTTFLARRSQVHQNHLVANITAGSGQTYRMLQGLRANFYAHGADAATASRKSIAAIYGMVQQHAAMLAFVEAFWLMGVVFLMMLPFLPLLEYSKAAKKPKSVPGTRQQLVSSDIAEFVAEDAGQEALEEEHHLVLH
jgi:DHA2 family multidrug resistance protein